MYRYDIIKYNDLNFIQGTINPCIDMKCNFGGVCKLINNRAVCKCAECAEYYDPVCGTNQITYKYNIKLKTNIKTKQLKKNFF